MNYFVKFQALRLEERKMLTPISLLYRRCKIAPLSLFTIPCNLRFPRKFSVSWEDSFICILYKKTKDKRVFEKDGVALPYRFPSYFFIFTLTQYFR